MASLSGLFVKTELSVILYRKFVATNSYIEYIFVKKG